jgi:hypothetical protein
MPIPSAAGLWRPQQGLGTTTPLSDQIIFQLEPKPIKMADSKYLSGDKEGLKEFIGRFDVSRSDSNRAPGERVFRSGYQDQRDTHDADFDLQVFLFDCDG